MKEDLENLINEFSASASLLTAIGDETRLHLIIEMMKMSSCDGARVGEISERVHLTRSQVSHHLQILKDAGIIKIRKDGTKNYYYFVRDMVPFKNLVKTINHTIDLASKLPKVNNE